MGKEDDNYSVCDIHGTGSVRRNEDVRDTEVHVCNEAMLMMMKILMMLLWKKRL